MLQPTPQHFRFWRSWRWRSSLLSGVCFLVVTSASASAQGYHPHAHQHPPPHYHGGHGGQGHSMLTGPSAMPPKYYYQIDGGARKLVQRQIAPGASGITAAATNYLLQQLEMERQQQQQHQQRSIALHQQQQLQQHQHQQQQQQTLNLLANLTPQQIAALQTVLPTMPRSNHPMAGTSNAAVAVMPPGSGGPPPHRHSYPHPTHPGPTYPPAPQQTFSSRMGPFDKLINKAKAWLPDMMSAGSAHPGGPGGPSSGGDAVGEPKMRDLHRLPKPPQYPLYDLPSIGQATPPPAPIMHPMASLPNSAFDMDQPQMGSSVSMIQSSSPRSTGKSHGGGYSHNSHNQQNWMSPSPTMSTSRRSRPSGPPRPPKPSKSSFLRNPLRFNKKSRPSPPDREPPVNYNRRNHGPHSSGGRRDGPPGGPRSRGKFPPITTKPPKKLHGGPHRGRYPGPSRRPPPPPGPTSDPFSTSQSQMGFEHPMASNLSPAQSPSLGRPLGYEEYMARPSHSYTDDPWNFDPFASQMNQGLHTSALRYNYDPLGMNALDTEANSHLDPNKLSYPGDSFNRDMAKDTPSTAQIGGWDKPYKKRPYGGDPETELTPPIGSAGYGSTNSFSSSPADPYGHTPPPSSLGSSSRRYKNQNRHRDQGGPSNGGTGFLGDSLNGGRRGEMAPLEDPMEGGSDLPPYGDEPVIDDAPRIDLESLQSGNPGDDGMEGLEFTIETTMDDKDQGQDGQMEESQQPDAHPLGPMQPAATPFLSDSYSPYAEQSAPVAQTVPGSPYGPNGYQRSRDERYGRRRTRNNHQGGGGQRSSRRSSSSRRRSRPQPQQELEVIEVARSVPQVAPGQSQATQSVEEVDVPEGVQIFNEIIRPQLLEKRSSKSRHLHNHHHHKQLRKTIYNAIRDETKK